MKRNEEEHEGKKYENKRSKNLLSLCIYVDRARGYPTPVVTWRREDGNEIILKDSMGSKTPGKCLYKSLDSYYLLLNIIVLFLFSHP